MLKLFLFIINRLPSYFSQPLQFCPTSSAGSRPHLQRIVEFSCNLYHAVKRLEKSNFFGLRPADVDCGIFKTYNWKQKAAKPIVVQTTKKKYKPLPAVYRKKKNRLQALPLRFQSTDSSLILFPDTRGVQKNPITNYT